MGYKKLISPEFRVTVGDYEVTDGIEVECFSSKESHMDWCRVELSPQLQGVLKFKDMDEASVELGYEDDFDSLIDGYVRCGDTDYWKEIMIKDDMMKLDRVTIKASFVDCEPQDVIRYVLACAGIEDYVLSDEHYGKKDLFVIDRKSGINTIAEVNSSWGIKNPFFFQKKVFYWGTKEEQKEIYVLEEGETILSLNKYGDLWEAETIAIPWIHHSQEVEVQHSKYSGIVTVEKTIVRSDDTGAVHMYIYFADSVYNCLSGAYYQMNNMAYEHREFYDKKRMLAKSMVLYKFDRLNIWQKIKLSFGKKVFADYLSAERYVKQEDKDGRFCL